MRILGQLSRCLQRRERVVRSISAVATVPLQSNESSSKQSRPADAAARPQAKPTWSGRSAQLRSELCCSAWQPWTRPHAAGLM